MSLTVFITAALFAVWRAWSGGGDRRWVRVAYAATALAILVKGPVAVVLVGGATLLFVLPHGGWRALRPAFDWRALALAAAIVLPWFLLVGWRNPEFWHYFVVDQNFHRYRRRRSTASRSGSSRPWCWAALAPWSLALAFDPRGLRGALDPRTWTPATRFLAIWAATIVVFFSLSTSKLVTYALPALPPLAILVARGTSLGHRARPRRRPHAGGVDAAGRRSDPGVGRRDPAVRQRPLPACRSWSPLPLRRRGAPRGVWSRDAAPARRATAVRGAGGVRRQLDGRARGRHRRPRHRQRIPRPRPPGARRNASRRSARALPELRPEHGLQQRRTLGDGGQPRRNDVRQSAGRPVRLVLERTTSSSANGRGRAGCSCCSTAVTSSASARKLDPPPIVLATKDKKVLAANRQ